MEGGSGGGPHALACEQLGQRVVDVASLAGVTPWTAERSTGSTDGALGGAGSQSTSPGADVRIYDEDGHLVLQMNRIGDVHAWLLTQY